MEKTCFILLSTLLLLLCSIDAEDQAEAFRRFRRGKLTRFNGGINRSEFDARELLFVTSQFEGSKTAPDLKEKDRIVKLPGQPDVSFKQYGGYVTVNSTAGRALYYYFVEAQRSPDSSPLLLWLNGGPGCSSLGYGAMEEIGPFRVHSDGKSLYRNEYAWNKDVNVLFLESPTGVGFSYSNNTNDTVTGGDKRTAIDNYAFLVEWIERFPEYRNRTFYIGGESYAGHFVPQLAQTILDQNKLNKTIINLKGIIIGNAEIDAETENIGFFEYFGSHALISDDVAYQIKKNCDFSPSVTNQSDACNNATDEAYKVLKQIDIYNIYGPRCSNSSLTDSPKSTSLLEFDPCTDNYVKEYLNRLDVQIALHANVTGIPYQWEFCSNALFQNWTDSPSTVLPLLKSFMDNGLRVWVYSGDVDGRVSVTTTQLAIKAMKLQIKNVWRPWYQFQEVGGYTQEYVDNFTFATVRGAGHDVPSFSPQRALSIFTHFLAGEKLPDSPAGVRL